MTTPRPGTVSKILWHFTGGPKRNGQDGRYENDRKSDTEAYKTLIAILESKKLKVGSYKEQIIANGSPVQTKRVCCVADIPIAHLGFHAEKYGKIALGFHRQSLIEARFNPVFYVKEDKAANSKFHDALSALQSLDTGPEEFMTYMLGDAGKDAEPDKAIREALAKSLKNMKSKVQSAADHLKVLQSFIKTLKYEDFDGIFCEREWRNDVDYPFTHADLAMVVLPKNAVDETNYHRKFINEKMGLISSEIPIVPWEDLIEH